MKTVTIKNLPKFAPRLIDSHKGDFGKLLIIAGSRDMAGAAVLSANAALRSGAGLVKVATSRQAQTSVSSGGICFTTLALADDDLGRITTDSIKPLLDAISNHDTVAVGCGLGQSSELVSLMRLLIELKDLPMVIDADGLNNLSRIKNWPDLCAARLILTPHFGEMSRLCTGLFRRTGFDLSDRKSCAIAVAKATGSIVVLKGSGTIVTDGEKIYINDTGNPGMATAGSGDVLTGMISSFCCQGLIDDFDAACLGVYLHGLAGDIAADCKGQISLIATDIIDFLPEAILRHQKC